MREPWRPDSWDSWKPSGRTPVESTWLPPWSHMALTPQSALPALWCYIQMSLPDLPPWEAAAAVNTLPEWLLQDSSSASSAGSSNQCVWLAKPGMVLVGAKEMGYWVSSSFNFHSGRMQRKDFSKKLRAELRFFWVVINWHFLPPDLQEKWRAEGTQ